MSAQVNLVAVRDGKILDSFVLSMTIPEARQSFCLQGNASNAFSAQNIIPVLKLCYSYHSQHTIPYSKYDARLKQSILAHAFDAYSKRIKASDGLFSFSDMEISELVKPLELKQKYMDKAEPLEKFNYVSECMMIASWMEFVERNQENELFIVIIGDMI